MKELQRGREPRAVAIAEEPGAEVFPGVGRAKALFMLAALLSFFASVYLFFTGDEMRGIFVGIWVPSILSLGALLLAGRGGDR